MSTIYYFKVIHDKFSLVTRRWLGNYKTRIELFFILLIICWVILIKGLVKDFLLFFIVVDELLGILIRKTNPTIIKPKFIFSQELL